MATFYRKYRGKRFDEVIGQDPIVTTLVNQIKLGRVGHAYLFTGSRGTGKTTCARIFARAVNCLHPVNGSPCGECEACKALESPECVDIIEMDAASNNGVDDARDIREKVKYLPVACKYKVYIIDEVHMLTPGAFNALLKTLEEPPEHVIFLLATTEPQKLPQTILSRCIRFDFHLIPTELLAGHIARIYDAEGIKYTKDAVYEIARLAEGSARDALSIADTISSAAELITPETVLALTGAGDSEGIAELFDSICTRSVPDALERIDTFATGGRSMSAVLRQLIDYSRNVLVVRSLGRAKAASGIVNADRASLERIGASADNCTMSDVTRILDELAGSESGLKYSVNPRVFLETVIVKLICGAQEQEDLLRRVSAIERKLNMQGQTSPAAEQKKNKVAPPPDAAVTRAEQPVPPEPISPPVRQTRISEPEPVAMSDNYVPPEPPPEPEEYASGHAGRNAFGAAKPDITVKPADEGEFGTVRAQSAGSGLELLGGIARYLRRNGTPLSFRIRELMSRGVTVKERSDHVCIIASDDCFLSLSEPQIAAELDKALAALGINKKARIERTAESLFSDDIERARELFGADNVTARSRRG